MSLPLKKTIKNKANSHIIFCGEQTQHFYDVRMNTNEGIRTSQMSDLLSSSGTNCMQKDKNKNYKALNFPKIMRETEINKWPYSAITLNAESHSNQEVYR